MAANFAMLNSSDMQVSDDQKTLINNINFWWNMVIIPTGIAASILCWLVVSQKAEPLHQLQCVHGSSGHGGYPSVDCQSLTSV